MKKHFAGSEVLELGSRMKFSLQKQVTRIEEAVYVCELRQKDSKSVGSLPSTEDGKIEVASPQYELKTINSDPSIFRQPTWRHGKSYAAGTEYPRKLRILCLHGFRQNASGFKGRTASLAKKLKNIAELVFIDAPHELSFIYQPSNASSPLQSCPPPLIRELQKEQQTDGFDVSLSYLKTVFSQQGPLDGILGFSQGAAMAASICALRERLKGELDFRFGILCSSYALPSTEFQPGSINCPSLHIFGNDLGKDRPIANQTSRDLAMVFENGCYAIIERLLRHYRT
ncbi:hypothetical protein Q3G72_011262 [Acer saccharum]|nr:hypothetical protein Q3G72_011262 [Acer saccharum]